MSSSAQDKESNESLQDDEIQALSAIYGDEWTVLNSEQRTFGINIFNERNHIFFQVTFPQTYPLDSPPVYQMSAPWMDRDNKRKLSDELNDIYCSNMGESIIFMWVEKVREYLECVSPKTNHITSKQNEEAWKEYNVDCETQYKNELPKIVHGDTIRDRKSVFQAHVATVVCKDQVMEVLAELKTNGKIASATHNILAYRVYQESNGKFYEDYDEDGEAKAGPILLNLLQVLDVRNVMVVVTRWYGGILLGSDRFRHIKASAREALVAAGFIKNQ